MKLLHFILGDLRMLGYEIERQCIESTNVFCVLVVKTLTCSVTLVETSRKRQWDSSSGVYVPISIEINPPVAEHCNLDPPKLAKIKIKN